MAFPDSCEPAAFTIKLPNVSGETIAVKVGLQIVDVHKDLISSSSEYFRKAISHESILSHRFIDLSDEKPHDFEIYCQWLYTRVLDAKLDNHNGFSYLARMYVLGEKLIDRTFQNDVVDAIIYRHITARLSQKPLRYKVPDLQAIGIIYEGAPRKAPVIRLLVDLWAFNMESSWVTKTRLRAPENKPFLDDLLPALLDRRGLPDASQARPWISQRSSYYNKGVVIKSEIPEDRGDEAIFEPFIKDEPAEEEPFVRNEPYVGDEAHIKEEPSMIDEPFIKEEPSSGEELSSEEASSSEDDSSSDEDGSPSEDELSNKTDPSVQEEVDVLDAFWDKSKTPEVKIPAPTPDTAMIALTEAGDDIETPNLRGDIVPIHVGNNPETLLHVHATALGKSSEFFKNALKSAWRTDPTKPIDMSDVDPAIFEGYCGWLYTGRVMHLDNDQSYRHLASLYVLGERIMDVTFQNSVVAAIIRRSQTSKKLPGNPAIQIIYAGTPAGSPARRLFVDFWVFNALPSWKGLEDLTKHTCADFANDLIRKFIEQRGAADSSVPRPWIADPKSYESK